MLLTQMIVRQDCRTEIFDKVVHRGAFCALERLQPWADFLFLQRLQILKISLEWGRHGVGSPLAVQEKRAALKRVANAQGSGAAAPGGPGPAGGLSQD